MSLADQIAESRAAGSAARYEGYGREILFRGSLVMATLSSPELAVIASEAGDEIRIEQTCAMPISTLAAMGGRPRRWESITLADGRELAIATLRTDEQRGDYVCQLANPSKVPVFS